MGSPTKQEKRIAANDRKIICLLKPFLFSSPSKQAVHDIVANSLTFL